jgi:hemoglobin
MQNEAGVHTEGDGVATPIDPAIPSRAQIEALVDCFYDRVRVDPELGPIFNAAITDWPAHKRQLTAFWASVLRREGSYRGNPMAAHRRHPITTAHFLRWLALWRATAEAVLTPAQAARVQAYAQRIAESLHHGLGLARARPVSPSEEGLNTGPAHATQSDAPSPRDGSSVADGTLRSARGFPGAAG